ncbi:MAG: hypothetical protein WC758_05680 [Candidatus Woesearchaeota archaeon]
MRNDPVFEDSDNLKEEKESRSMSFSFFSFFRKRIPDEEELERKEHKKLKEQQLAAMKDDDDEEDQIVSNKQTAQIKTTIVEEDDFPKETNTSNTNLESREIKDTRSEPGFMSKIFGFGNKKQEQEEHAMALQEQQQNIEELKETIKVLHKWLEKLPPERITEFKRSPDFEKYKSGLRKLGLIKE